ncbi:chlororespiratory reduction protein 7 [[Limnothrix rosea] IAM M-220]|uniref:chlororespiratory reduction protein 7 n=1 Tax=[Limnothrix rosea] IAM M-220 TaxID=454133 RepID=UPI000959FE2B|nr:chlororespiratory reduction protein 7 [[Limnothrix rosea] IAM M-220]OKH17793.1 hypothetical protein NIES208_08210 [[Limnothrix rosea] IAM M-220]
MPDPIMYQEDGYVVLRHDQPEQIMESDEIRQFFRDLFTKQPDLLPSELATLSTDAQITKLLEDYCELEIPDGFLQWYAVRFEK